MIFKIDGCYQLRVPYIPHNIASAWNATWPIDAELKEDAEIVDTTLNLLGRKEIYGSVKFTFSDGFVYWFHSRRLASYEGLLRYTFNNSRYEKHLPEYINTAKEKHAEAINELKLKQLNDAEKDLRNLANTSQKYSSSSEDDYSTAADAIKKYKQLLDEGAISEEEYAQIKEHILNLK